MPCYFNLVSQLQVIQDETGVEVLTLASRASEAHRRAGGSDARTILGSDESALNRLWQEKRGEIEPEDLAANLLVQFRCVTQDLNRRWFERQTGHSIGAVQRFVRHPKLEWMGATLDGLLPDAGAVFEAKFMLP